MNARPPGISSQTFEKLLVTRWGHDASEAIDGRENAVEVLGILRAYIDGLAADERTFGPSTALRDYGRVFNPASADPSWLIRGAAKRCYVNASAYASVRDDVYYAEGYAIDLNLPIPIEHAWLVNSSGEVIDPTWGRAVDHVYFGVAFEQISMKRMLSLNGGEAGVLPNFHRLRESENVRQLINR